MNVVPNSNLTKLYYYRDKQGKTIYFIVYITYCSHILLSRLIWSIKQVTKWVMHILTIWPVFLCMESDSSKHGMYLWPGGVRCFSWKYYVIIRAWKIDSSTDDIFRWYCMSTRSNHLFPFFSTSSNQQQKRLLSLCVHTCGGTHVHWFVSCLFMNMNKNAIFDKNATVTLRHLTGLWIYTLWNQIESQVSFLYARMHLHKYNY